jgi:hypothetical protein
MEKADKQLCEAIASEDIPQGEMVLIDNGRARIATDWSGGSGVLWRATTSLRSGQKGSFFTIKIAGT